MEPVWPFVRVRVAAAALALATVIALATDGAASGTPSASCREELCAGAVRVGPVPVTWSSPELFYPNNEDLFAAVHVGPRPLAEVRRYGPALCRHRFVGARISVMIKACLSETTLRVRAASTRKRTRLLQISYAARPDIGGDMEPTANSATIYDGLTQITGIVTGSSGL